MIRKLTNSLNKSTNGKSSNKPVPVSSKRLPTTLIEEFDHGDHFAFIKNLQEHPEYLTQACDSDNNSLLHLAARRGDTLVFLTLLENGASLYLTNAQQWYPLHLAVMKGHVALVMEILKHVHRSMLTRKNSDGLNSLHIAAFFGHGNIIEMLLSAGCPIDEKTSTGWSALHLAASNNHLDAVVALLRAGASPNLVRKPQGTALHLSTREGHIDIIKALLKYGADISIQDGRGKIPKQMTSNRLILELLIDAERANLEQNKENSLAPLDQQKELENLQQIEATLIQEVDQYKQQHNHFRRTSKLNLNPAGHTPRSQEEEESEQIRLMSVVPELQNREDSAPPISAWRESALTQEDDQELAGPDYSQTNCKAIVAAVVGAENEDETDTTFIYPGAERVVQSFDMVCSWIARVAGIVFDEQAQESMEQILRLLASLFQDRRQGRSMDSILALSSLILYYNNKSICSGKVVEKIEVLNESVHFFKFACAAYGWKMLNPLMFSQKRGGVLIKGFAVGDKVNEEALCEHTGIGMDDIITSKWTSSDYHPAHYLCVDHSTGSIVLAIRGSFHVKDALADLIASAVPFQGGFAHTGILECAKRKFDTIQKPLMETIGRFPNYKVRIVGHSLGAGTASLLTLILREILPPAIDLHCHAYAPPCVLSPQLALAVEPLITSYVLNNDCVPRLSYGSIKHLSKLTSKIMDQGTGFRLLYLAKRGQIDIAQLKLDIPFSIDTVLLPPGKCYHIMPETLNDSNREWANSESLKGCFRMEQSSPTLFTELLVCSSMFSDHVPWSYNAAFEGVLKRHTMSLWKRKATFDQADEPRFDQTLHMPKILSDLEPEELTDDLPSLNLNNNQGTDSA